MDLSSASEVSENESDDSDSRDLSGYACRHCFTTSKYYYQFLQIFPLGMAGMKYCVTAALSESNIKSLQ